jgi:diguanylate cyclase (GGDEF)-like protein
VTTRRPRSPGLAAELRRSHRLTLGVLVSVLVLSLATSGFLILVTQPRLASYVQLARETRQVHEGMLDQDTGLRGWLATGDRRFLATYESGSRLTDVAADALLHSLQRTPDGTSDLVLTLLARQRWEGWARRAAAATFTPTQRADGTLRRFLVRGDDLFTDYRAAEARSIALLTTHRTQATDLQNTALRVVLISYLVLLAGAGLVAGRRLRRLRRTLLAPIDNLHETIAALRSGHLSARADPTDVPELAEMGDALDRLASQLARAATEAATRERRLARLAYRFETVVRVGREIAGSLSVPFVSQTVTTAAAELLNTSAVLWLRGDNATFEAMHRSRDPNGLVPPVDPAPPVIVARAAADAHPASEGGRTAYPLVQRGSVTAVLEVATTAIDPDTDQVLTALLSTAAASLESAHLHSTARELADLDGLTHLPNRRRFGTDIETEWERCRRYGRPLSLVMMDLDHFKRLNDEHGHLLGDEVLREVARVLVDGLRTTDTAYRYGGEEIVVLLRETRLEDASSAAERLRAAVAAIRMPQHPEVTVSASAGVSTRRSTMSGHTELLAEADRALYEAKRLGRDRVVTAPAVAETLVHGGPSGSLVPPQVTPRAGL